MIDTKTVYPGGNSGDEPTFPEQLEKDIGNIVMKNVFASSYKDGTTEYTIPSREGLIYELLEYITKNK